MLAAAADRERTIDVLKAAFGEGRLTKEEFDSRSGRVLAARTYADLAAIVADLPAGPGGPGAVMPYHGYYPQMASLPPTNGLAIGAMICGIAEIFTLGLRRHPRGHPRAPRARPDQADRRARRRHGHRRTRPRLPGRSRAGRSSSSSSPPTPAAAGQPVAAGHAVSRPGPYLGRFSVLAGGQRGDERLLRYLHAADRLHPLLAFLLLLEQLPLAGDVTAVALGEDVLAQRADVLPGDDPDCRRPPGSAPRTAAAG